MSHYTFYKPLTTRSSQRSDSAFNIGISEEPALGKAWDLQGSLPVINPLRALIHYWWGRTRLFWLGPPQGDHYCSLADLGLPLSNHRAACFHRCSSVREGCLPTRAHWRRRGVLHRHGVRTLSAQPPRSRKPPPLSSLVCQGWREAIASSCVSLSGRAALRLCGW